MAKKILYVNVDEEKHQQYKEYAVKHKTDISNLVRTALEYYINRGEDDGLGRTTKEVD